MVRQFYLIHLNILVTDFLITRSIAVLIAIYIFHHKKRSTSFGDEMLYTQTPASTFGYTHCNCDLGSTMIELILNFVSILHRCRDTLYISGIEIILPILSDNQCLYEVHCLDSIVIKKLLTFGHD